MLMMITMVGKIVGSLNHLPWTLLWLNTSADWRDNDEQPSQPWVKSLIIISLIIQQKCWALWDWINFLITFFQRQKSNFPTPIIHRLSHKTSRAVIEMVQFKTLSFLKTRKFPDDISKLEFNKRLELVHWGTASQLTNQTTKNWALCRTEIFCNCFFILNSISDVR